MAAESLVVSEVTTAELDAAFDILCFSIPAEWTDDSTEDTTAAAVLIRVEWKIARCREKVAILKRRDEGAVLGTRVPMAACQWRVDMRHF